MALLLDSNYFQRVLSEKVGEEQWDAFRTKGQPLILSGKDNVPLASLHVKTVGFRTKARALFHANPKPANTTRKEFQPHFGALINVDRQPFAFVITNLCQQGYIAFCIMKYEPGEEDDPNRPTRLPINKVNLLQPGQSYVVRGDQNTSKTFMLNAVQDAVTGEHTKVKTDEKHLRQGKQARTEGTYYRVMVIPQFNQPWQDKAFEGDVRWHCPDLITLRQAIVSRTVSRTVLREREVVLAPPRPCVRAHLTPFPVSTLSLFQRFNIPVRLKDGCVEVLATTRLPESLFGVDDDTVYLKDGDTGLTKEYEEAFKIICKGVHYMCIHGTIHVVKKLLLDSSNFIVMRSVPNSSFDDWSDLSCDCGSEEISEDDMGSELLCEPTERVESIEFTDGGNDDEEMGNMSEEESEESDSEESDSEESDSEESDSDMGCCLFGNCSNCTTRTGDGGSKEESEESDEEMGFGLFGECLSPISKQTTVECIVPKGKDVRGESLVSEVSGGEELTDEKVIDMDDLEFDWNHLSPQCVFSLSVAPTLTFTNVPSFGTLTRWAQALFQSRKNATFKVNKTYRSDACCICLEDDSGPDIVFYACGHACCHATCATKLTNCPLCRGHITATLILK